MQPTSLKEEVPSPFANLNGRFEEQNQMLSDLISRLSSKLHRLSDTNYPTAETNNKEVLPDLPFREGYLMDYYFKLNNFEGLISRLAEQVNKLENLT